MTVVFTVGHSNHPEQVFVDILLRNGINAIADVRSSPYSHFNPQFNRESLVKTLRRAGIAYVFLGGELGARSEDCSCYENGKVLYDRLAQTDSFRRGLERVIEGSKSYRVALMCAEKDPLDCHRTILVGRHLVNRGVELRHILSEGDVETHEEALVRLLKLVSLAEQDLFRSQEQTIAHAYAIRGQEIAYDREGSASTKSTVEGREIA